MKSSEGFSKKQVELVEAIIKFGTIKKAAKSLNISYSSAKQRMYRLRRTYQNAVDDLNYLEEINFYKILSKIPACQTCKFLKLNGKCRYSDSKIDVNLLDKPCIYWQQGELKGSFSALSFFRVREPTTEQEGMEVQIITAREMIEDGYQSL